MQIDLIAVGKRMPDWIESAIKEYRKRLPKQIQLNIIEINPANRSRKNSTDNYKLEEQERIVSAIRPDSLIVVLDETGKQCSSKELAVTLRAWADEQQSVSLIIGGADGVSEELKRRAQWLWSLSSLTLPHGLVRALLVEQIYRAWTITSNHPYHRE